MSRTRYEPPAPFRSRPKPTQPTIETRPHTMHVLANSGVQMDIVFDTGPTEPVHVVTLTRDMCVLLRDAMTRKLGATT